MVDKPLRILLVEDEVAHAELVQRTFEVYGERARLSVARTLAEARAYLASEPLRPDLIIADWRLPDGDGMELLPPERNERATPVVIMTSYGDERVAVEAMKAGALDYMVKSETVLLDMPHIAERAIREWTMLAERARIESELRESEARFRGLVEQSSDGISLLDEQGAIIEWNLANEKITGLRRDQVMGRPIGQVQLELAPERDGRQMSSERMKAATLETFRLGPESALG
jgi:DNA-binding NtrC family response regulator